MFIYDHSFHSNVYIPLATEIRCNCLVNIEILVDKGRRQVLPHSNVSGGRFIPLGQVFSKRFSANLTSTQ